jgi:hypothetical protein
MTSENEIREQHFSGIEFLNNQIRELQAKRDIAICKAIKECHFVDYPAMMHCYRRWENKTGEFSINQAKM